MSEFLGLLCHCSHDFRVAVAGVGDCNPGGKIDVALALHIPDFAILGAIHKNWRGCADAARNGRVTALKKSCIVVHS